MCDEEKPKSKGPNKINVAGRIAAMALAVASVFFMASACQCTMYGQYGEPGRQTVTCATYFPYGEPEHTVTFKDFAPYLYLVVANAIAAGLLAIAIFLSIWKKGADDMSKVLLPFLDVTVPALLYSSTAAVFAAGDMTYCSAYGRRVSVCAGSTGNFCTHVHTSMYIALAAAITVSVTEMAKNVSLSQSSGGHVSDACSESSCGHGCGHKH